MRTLAISKPVSEHDVGPFVIFGTQSAVSGPQGSPSSMYSRQPTVCCCIDVAAWLTAER